MKKNEMTSTCPEVGMPIINDPVMPTQFIAEPIDKNGIEYKRGRAKEMVRGKFVNHEAPGGLLSFCYRVPFKGEHPERYDMRCGEIYSVPRAVAKHLNTSGSYPEYSYIEDAQGRPTMKIMKNVRRYSFQSLEFWDEDDMLEQMPNKIIQASYI